MRRLVVLAVLVFPVVASAADDPDPIAAQVEAARGAHDTAVDAAHAKLLAEFDKWIDNAPKAGKLDVLQDLKAQRSDFQASATPPTAAQLQTGKARYESAVRAAKRTLAKALQAAEVAYTKAGRIEDAQAVQDERRGLEGDLAAEVSKKATDAPDALLQPGSHWIGRGSLYSRDAKGQLVHEALENDMIVKSRDGDRFMFQVSARNLATGQTVERDNEGLLGRVERSSQGSRRRFTWGEGPGLREGWISGAEMRTSQVAPDGRWRTTGHGKLVPGP